MRNITLICSAHNEYGLCNAEELLKILRAIEPEVIFEEIRLSDFDAFYKNLRTLEPQAITRYSEFKSFRQVPVDQFDIPENLRAETDRVFGYVEHASFDYRPLNEQNYESVYRYGFRYLNSVGCATMMSRIAEIEDKTIIESSDQDLIQALETWRRIHERRELAMLDNIYEYCRENAFDTGVFLVGAEHKAGIVKGIQRYASTEADLINWNLADDGQIPWWPPKV